MERNGKKHGMVRLTAIAKTPAAPPIAKAPTKPANHSKLTGTCRRDARGKESRSIPESKSRDKAKGAWKLKSCDVLLNHRLVAWRVVVASAGDDDEEGRRRRRRHLSATEMVEKLYANCNTLHESLTMEEDEEEEDDDEQEAEHDIEAEKEFNGGDEETEMNFHAVAGVSRECAEGEEWLLVNREVLNWFVLVWINKTYMIGNKN